jgi:hypothetical protein
MFFIFTSEEAARSYVADCDAALGLPRAGAANGVPRTDGVGTTETWAEPQQHPAGDRWAVPVPGVLVRVPPGEFVDELDASWFPPSMIASYAPAEAP